MFEMLSQSWITIIVLFGVPALIAGYFAMRRSAGPLTDAMREMEEPGEDVNQNNTEVDR